MYLHEVWPQVRKWAADKKVLDMDYIILLTLSLRREFLDLLSQKGRSVIKLHLFDVE